MTALWHWYQANPDPSLKLLTDPKDGILCKADSGALFGDLFKSESESDKKDGDQNKEGDKKDEADPAKEDKKADAESEKKDDESKDQDADKDKDKDKSDSEAPKEEE